jgi:hypothetical protein
MKKTYCGAVGDNVLNMLIKNVAFRRATKYISDKLTFKATRQRRFDEWEKQQTYIVTIGAPNYAEKKFIKLCKECGEPFPVKKIVLQSWPKKARKA